MESEDHVEGMEIFFFFNCCQFLKKIINHTDWGNWIDRRYFYKEKTKSNLLRVNVNIHCIEYFSSKYIQRARIAMEDININIILPNKQNSDFLPEFPGSRIYDEDGVERKNRIVNRRRGKEKGRNTEGDEPGSNIEARHGKEARTSNLES